MAGILANSASVSMSSAISNGVQPGFSVGETVTLTTTPVGSEYYWYIEGPDKSTVSLDSVKGVTTHFTPDKIGIYQIGVKVGITYYSLRMLAKLDVTDFRDRLNVAVTNRDVFKVFGARLKDNLGTEMTELDLGCIDVREFGAMGDSGVTDNRAPIQTAIDAAGDAGGGYVRVPGLTDGGYYGITAPVWMRDNVHVVGDGPSSWIHNTFGGTVTNANESSLFEFGGYYSAPGVGGQPTWYDEQQIAIDDVAIGDYILQCQTPADAASVASGDLIWIASAQRDATVGHAVPLHNAMNEVISSDSNTGQVIVKYPILDPIESYLGVPATFYLTTGTLNHASGHPCKIVKRASVRNLRLTTTPGRTWAIIPLGGMWECTLRDLWLDGEVAFSFNWAGRCLVENVYARLTRKAVDDAVGSIGTTWRNIHAHYYSGPVGPGLSAALIHIANGERTRDNVFDGVHMYSETARRAVTCSALRSRYVNCNFFAPSIKDDVNGLVTLLTNSTLLVAEGNVIEDCRFRIDSLNQPAITIQAEPVGGTLRNIVRHNIIEAPITKGMPAIDVRPNGSNVLIEGNHLPNNWIRLQEGMVTGAVELRNNVTRHSLHVQEEYRVVTANHVNTTEEVYETFVFPTLAEYTAGDSIDKALEVEVWGTYKGTAGTGTLRVYHQGVLRGFWSGIVGTSGGTHVWHLRYTLIMRDIDAQVWASEMQHSGATVNEQSGTETINMSTTPFTWELRGFMSSAGASGNDNLAIRRVEVRPAKNHYRTS